jgi:hypothetical protein
VPLSSPIDREPREPDAGEDHDTEAGDRNGEHADRKE